MGVGGAHSGRHSRDEEDGEMSMTMAALGDALPTDVPRAGGLWRRLSGAGRVVCGAGCRV